MDTVTNFFDAVLSNIQVLGAENVLLLSIFVLLLVVWLRIKQLLRRLNEVSRLEKNREQLFVEGEAGTHRQLMSIQEQLDSLVKKASSN